MVGCNSELTGEKRALSSREFRVLRTSTLFSAPFIRELQDARGNFQESLLTCQNAKQELIRLRGISGELMRASARRSSFAQHHLGRRVEWKQA
jgi:hypothetical protein